MSKGHTTKEPVWMNEWNSRILESVSVIISFDIISCDFIQRFMMIEFQIAIDKIIKLLIWIVKKAELMKSH